MDYRLALMTGTDIPIPECQLILHQPSMKEIGMIGEESFLIGIQHLWMDKNAYLEGNVDLSESTNFQIFMTIMQDKASASKKQDTLSVLKLLFPSYNIMLTPRSIILNSTNGSIIIDENNFEFFQNTLREVFCYRTANKDSFNPANEEARKIAQKLMRGRQRVAAQKGDTGGSIFSRYISILTIGLGAMSLEDLINCTVYQLYDLIERYQLYIAWDLDARTRLAGGKPDQNPEDWMKNIH